MNNKDLILGVNFGHDTTTVLIKNGEVLESIQEERLSRQKRHSGFPHLGLTYIKKKYNIDSFEHVFIPGLYFRDQIFITLEDVIKRKKEYKKGRWFFRALGAKYTFIGLLFRFREWLLYDRKNIDYREKTKLYLQEQFPNVSPISIHHHLAHAWATVPFMPDTKKKRIILTLDGEGDYFSGSINIFDKGTIELKHSISNIHSLGALYCAIVDLLGMTPNEHEFKVMGLAPYAKKSSGEKVYEKLKELIWFDAEKMEIISTIDTRRAIGYLIANDYGHHRFDSLAYGIQKLTEEIIKDMARAAIKKYNCTDLAVGGGVFMNVKANQYLSEMSEVDSLVVAPSCGDESLALGAAVYGYAQVHHNDLSSLKQITNLYLGSEYTDKEVKEAIDIYPFIKQCTVTYFDPTSSDTIEKRIAEILASNSVVGRLKGRAEWGARALGNRSILANASSRDNVKLINEMIKGRDFWMPFATSMLYERRKDYLDDPKDTYAPFMAITFNTKPLAHKELIAALHPYDLTSRPQMVKKEINPEYYALISHFQTLTGSGGILNTSFNLHGEPNVEAPVDALRTFEHSGLPHVAIGNYLISKK